MITNGWPAEKSIFEHAAHEILNWASENKDNYRGLVGRSLEKRSDLIFASRDNIPEVGKWREMTEIERHRIEMAEDQDTDQTVKKIELTSKKSLKLTTNKLDLSIFQFKDRPLFKKKDGIELPNSGAVELKLTRPAKIPLAKVEDTSFTL
jgi:hypothetical protein